MTMAHVSVLYRRISGTIVRQQAAAGLKAPRNAAAEVTDQVVILAVVESEGASMWVPMQVFGVCWDL